MMVGDNLAADHKVGWSTKCTLFSSCQLDAGGENWYVGARCILHSRDPNKDKEAFNAALLEHREKGQDNYSYFVFPQSVDFRDTVFKKRALFRGATFYGEAYFE